MEKTYKVYMINEQGKKIVKEVPKELYMQYINMGWKDNTKPIVEEKEEIKPIESGKKKSIKF